MRALLACAVLPALLACGEETAPPPPSRDGDLGGLVARVGDEGISSDTVRRIAAAQGISLAEARDRAVKDALFAAEARARGLGDESSSAAVAARALFRELRREEERPVSDEELERVTERHWLDLRRPPSRRFVHAVALVPEKKKRDEQPWETSDAVAQALREAVKEASALARLAPTAAAKDPAVDSFRQRAASVDGRGLEIRTERLDPVAADGRFVRPAGGGLVVEFMKAVEGLKERGDLTPTFRTSFGYHVAMLLEDLPGLEVPKEERRRRVREEVVDDRIRKRRAALLEAGAATVEVPVNASALLDLVRVQ